MDSVRYLSNFQLKVLRKYSLIWNGISTKSKVYKIIYFPGTISMLPLSSNIDSIWSPEGVNHTLSFILSPYKNPHNINQHKVWQTYLNNEGRTMLGNLYITNKGQYKFQRLNETQEINIAVKKMHKFVYLANRKPQCLYEGFYTNRCRACQKPLKEEESKELGFGKACSKFHLSQPKPEP